MFASLMAKTVCFQCICGFKLLQRSVCAISMHCLWAQFCLEKSSSAHWETLPEANHVKKVWCTFNSAKGFLIQFICKVKFYHIMHLYTACCIKLEPTTHSCHIKYKSQKSFYTLLCQILCHNEHWGEFLKSFIRERYNLAVDLSEISYHI